MDDLNYLTEELPSTLIACCEEELRDCGWTTDEFVKLIRQEVLRDLAACFWDVCLETMETPRDKAIQLVVKVLEVSEATAWRWLNRATTPLDYLLLLLFVLRIDITSIDQKRLRLRLQCAVMAKIHKRVYQCELPRPTAKEIQVLETHLQLCRAYDKAEQLINRESSAEEASIIRTWLRPYLLFRFACPCRKSVV